MRSAFVGCEPDSELLALVARLHSEEGYHIYSYSDTEKLLRERGIEVVTVGETYDVTVFDLIVLELPPFSTYQNILKNSRYSLLRIAAIKMLSPECSAAVIVDPEDFKLVGSAEDGMVGRSVLMHLAAKAFEKSIAYDKDLFVDLMHALIEMRRSE